MPTIFTQKVIRKLQANIDQDIENNEWIYANNSRKITEKTIASLKANKIIISHATESKARGIIKIQIEDHKQQMINRIAEKMKQTFPNIL
jgi:hypothetical protein